MRLNNGQVGRVQSLSVPSAGSSVSVNIHSSRVSSEISKSEDQLSEFHARGGSTGPERYAPQVDYRQDPTPLESCSLADYIRMPSSSLPVSTYNDKAEEPALQAQMESEFPKLDSALIAAILADYSDSAEAKNVLSALS